MWRIAQVPHGFCVSLRSHRSMPRSMSRPCGYPLSSLPASRQDGQFLKPQPRDSNMPELRNIPSIIIGTRKRFKVYSLIMGYWSLWEALKPEALNPEALHSKPNQESVKESPEFDDPPAKLGEGSSLRCFRCQIARVQRLKGSTFRTSG